LRHVCLSLPTVNLLPLTQTLMPFGPHSRSEDQATASSVSRLYMMTPTMAATVESPHVLWEEKIPIEPDLGDQRQSTYKALPSPPKTPKRVMMKYRFSGVFPLILSLAVFVLSLVMVLAGQNEGTFGGQYLVAVSHTLAISLARHLTRPVEHDSTRTRHHHVRQSKRDFGGTVCLRLCFYHSESSRSAESTLDQQSS
jgi:hypothetical protein